MIDKISLSPEWLEEKKAEHKGADPTIMERVIFGLYLLQRLKLSGLELIFKGGTSLILLLDKPARFSVDIDVIISPNKTGEEIEGHLSKVLEDDAFFKFVLDERRSYKEGIPKAHYKAINKPAHQLLIWMEYKALPVPYKHLKTCSFVYLAYLLKCASAFVLCDFRSLLFHRPLSPTG